MDGVFILATEQVASAWKFDWWAFAIAFIAVALFVLFMAYMDDMLDEAVCYVMMGVFGIVAGVLLGFALSSPIEYETQYKVAIVQDVSMIEFCEVYEIVEQDGLIFTVREKEND